MVRVLTRIGSSLFRTGTSRRPCHESQRNWKRKPYNLKISSSYFFVDIIKLILPHCNDSGSGPSTRGQEVSGRLSGQEEKEGILAHFQFTRTISGGASECAIEANMTPFWNTETVLVHFGHIIKGLASCFAWGVIGLQIGPANRCELCLFAMTIQGTIAG